MTARTQRGGTLAGLVVGIVAGLAIALVAAVYVNKVPVPFLNGASRLADQDAKEAERNKNWNPNATLGNGATNGPTAPTGAAPGTPAAPAVTGQADAGAPAAGSGASNDPLGDLARAKTQGASTATTAAAPASAPPASSTAPYAYYIQAGAFRAPDEADAQRAQLAMLGWESRLSEGQQNGRALYRVRIGPFARRDDAEQLKGKLDDAGVNSILVRVAR